MPKHIAICAALLASSLLCAAPSFAKTAAVVRHASTESATSATNEDDHLSSFSRIHAIVNFNDDGTTMTVAGVGTGFDSALSYTSFFYGTGSVSRGSLACFPPTPNNLTAVQMITAYWLPVGSTRRTLYVQKTGTSYVSLSQVATFSVRYDSTPTLPLLTNLNPGRYWLNSCGKIH